MEQHDKETLRLPVWLRRSAWPSAREWWEALRFVCLTLTLVIALALLGSFISYERVVAEGHPWLPRTECPGCLFCGMTRSFCALSAGRWQEAWNWNRGGPFLYAGGWLWLAAAVWLTGRTILRKRAGARRR